MDKASAALDFERAATYRDRIAALSAITSHQGINPRTLEEADVFALHQAGGYTCVQVFFFRAGQNWGNRAYFPRVANTIEAADEEPGILDAFLGQFYESQAIPRLILLSHDVPNRELLAEAFALKTGHKVEIAKPVRGEKRDLVAHA